MEMTADELIEFYQRHYSDGITFKEIFGEEYDFNSLIRRFSTREIIMQIQEWKDLQEKK